MADFQLRHFDYVLPLGTLAAGQTIREAALTMDLDADFVLTGRAVHYASLTPGLAGQSALVNYFDRYTGPDTGDYLSQALLRFSAENPDFGQYGSPLPLRPPVAYPRGGSLLADVSNRGNVDYTNLTLYFRGYKMYPAGQLPCNVMPEKSSVLPFVYQGSSFVNGAPVNYVPMAQQTQSLNNPLFIAPDADFIIRSLTVGSMNQSDPLAQYYQMFIQLKDQNSKSYSNLPVHVDVCFGAFGSVVTNQQVFSRVGPFHPGLLTPEIYQPANTFLYYDLYRKDNYIGGPGGLSPVNLQLAFNGMKVFHR
jgi:hypothetical protein